MLRSNLLSDNSRKTKNLMNIFEDLIDELKEENLLEKSDAQTKSPNEKVVIGDKKSAADREKPADSRQNDSSFALADNPKKSGAVDFQVPERKSAETKKPVDKTEFFRRRATDEVSGLQMVEHIFSGVERQQKKMVPKPYDDLAVKKALHNFLQVSENVNSREHAAAEFELMQETESWYSALSHRDKQISIINLRSYCEAARPALSAPALLALARFYRNSPYSEAVRSKFDLIVTRLFSKDLPGEKREVTFGRDDLINHLSELYAEWESVSLYEGEQEESEILLAAFTFEDFMSEAQRAEGFDELIKNDFFNRLRSFKESAGENFFSPLITATAVECNIRIGNRYVELLEQEKERGEVEKLGNKYGFLHDQVISAAASKSFQLVELLKTRSAETEKAEIKDAKNEIIKTAGESTGTAATRKSTPDAPRKNLPSVNKWLLITAAAVLLISVSLYVWSMYYAAPEKLSRDVKKVNIDNSSLKEYVRDARIGNNTFFAVVLPAWNNLTAEKKEEVLKKIVTIGADKGFKNVHLLSADGKSVGTVAENFIEVKN